MNFFSSLKCLILKVLVLGNRVALNKNAFFTTDSFHQKIIPSKTSPMKHLYLFSLHYSFLQTPFCLKLHLEALLNFQNLFQFETLRFHEVYFASFLSTLHLKIKLVVASQFDLKYVESFMNQRRCCCTLNMILGTLNHT